MGALFAGTPMPAAYAGRVPDDQIDQGVASLYTWAGGGDSFRRLIDAFYDRVEQDDLLSPLFPGGVGDETSSRRVRPNSEWRCSGQA